ncbi:MAG: hypothetical protein IJI11_04130 [Mogibacterium sp.]|nr:hypothetical protein [Mogibacterium sp.]
MKKSIALILTIILSVSCIILTACGSGSGSGSSADLTDSKYVGTWKLSNINFMNDSSELDIDYTLTLNGDGTGIFVAIDGDTEDRSEVTWELTDNGFKTKGGTKLTFTDDGDNIKTKLLGVELVFAKQ